MITAIRKGGSLFRDWTWRNQLWLRLTFWICLTIGIIVDILMVSVWDLYSISQDLWAVCEEHPTIDALIILMGLGIGWLVRSSWVCVILVGLLIGHLALHQ